MHDDPMPAASREPEAIRHELDYWKALLTDLVTVDAAVGRASDALVSLPVAFLDYILSAGSTKAAGEHGRLTGAAFAELMTITKTVGGMLELVGGRVSSIAAEVGVTLDEGKEGDDAA